MIPLHRVRRHLVDQMLFVKNKMELELAYAFQNTLAILMKVVDLNVY